MRRIWKFALDIGNNRLVVPKGSRLLSLAAQHNVPTIWVECTDTKLSDIWEITGVVTGHEYEEIDGEFIGTAILDNGSFVVHYFGKTYD